jgi:hypothetical protein
MYATSNQNLNFGYNILTEVDEPDDDENSYQEGKSTKQHNTVYTRDALILQSILKYSRLFGTENYFTSREIIKNYLFNNCSVYKGNYEHDKTNIGSRIEYINTKITSSLEKLVYLELVESEQHFSKNHEETKMYRFTKLGGLIGLLLFWIKDDLPDFKLYEEIYTQCIQFYKTMSHSHALFCKIFFIFCYGEGKFPVIINSLNHLLKNASNDKNHFLNQIKFLAIFYRDSKMWNIYKISLEELSLRDYLKYQVVLFNLKLSIEEIHETKYLYLADFEVLRYKERQSIDKVVVGTYCNNCKHNLVTVLGSLIYLELYINSVISDEFVTDVKCPMCQKGFLDFQTEYRIDKNT